MRNLLILAVVGASVTHWVGVINASAQTAEPVAGTLPRMLDIRPFLRERFVSPHGTNLTFTNPSATFKRRWSGAEPPLTGS
jgi:hypothetical protein